jgi:hypothetical protein
MDHEGTPVFFGLKKLRNSQLKERNNLGVVISTFNMTASDGSIVSKVKVWSPKTLQVHTCEEDMVMCLNNRAFDKKSVIVLDWRALLKDIPADTYIKQDGTVNKVYQIPFRAQLARLVDIPMAQWPKDLERTIKSWDPIACLINLNGQDVIYKGKFIRWSYGVEGGRSVGRDPSLKDRNVWVAYLPNKELQAWQLITEATISWLMQCYEGWKAGKL